MDLATPDLQPGTGIAEVWAAILDRKPKEIAVKGKGTAGVGDEQAGVVKGDDLGHALTRGPGVPGPPARLAGPVLS